MSELEIGSIEKIAYKLEDAVRSRLDSKGVSTRDGGGFSIAVLSTIKMLEEAGVEIPDETKLDRAMDPAAESVDQAIESATEGSWSQPGGSFARV